MQRQIRMTSIVESKNAIRANYEGIHNLMSSIQSNGLLHPPAVRKVGRKFEIVAGHRRYQALKKLGYKTIPVEIVSFATEDEAKIAQMAENMSRMDVTLAELGVSITQLDKSGLTTKELATRIGVDVREIKMARIAMSNLPQTLHNKVTRGRSSVYKGTVSLAKTKQILAAGKKHRLTKKQTEELFNSFSNTSTAALQTAAALIYKGVGSKEVSEKINSLKSGMVPYFVDNAVRKKYNKKIKGNLNGYIINILKQDKILKEMLVFK